MPRAPQPKPDKPESILCPFTVVIDSNESQANHRPYQFVGLRSNADEGNLPIVVPTTVLNLYVADYSILGLPRAIVERKSMADLFQSVKRRENFEERLAEMSSSAYDFAAIVIEAEYSEIMLRPPRYSKMLPKPLMRSIFAWMTRYRVQWVPMPDRWAAEQATFRLLEFYWKAHRLQQVIPASPSGSLASQ